MMLLLSGPQLLTASAVPTGAQALQPTETVASTSAPLNLTALFHMMLENGYFDIVPSHRYRKPTHDFQTALDDSVFEQDAVGEELPPGKLEYGEHKLVADHEWLQVMRFGPKCRATIEGHSIGFPTDCGNDYVQMNRSDLASCSSSSPPAKVGYGCWFYFAQPNLQKFSFGKDFLIKRSSGISVNVGKSLRVDSRASAAAALGLPCANPPLCNQEKTAQDKLYCERAVQRGYDSIQFARPHLPCLEASCLSGKGPGWTSELVLCTGQCMTNELTQACPPGVELQTAGGKPCNCSNESHALNCGKGSMLYGRPDDGKQTCPKLTSPELGELYNINLTVIAVS